MVEGPLERGSLYVSNPFGGTRAPMLTYLEGAHNQVLTKPQAEMRKITKFTNL